MTNLFDYIQQQYPDYQSLGNQSMFAPMAGQAGMEGSGTGKLHNMLKMAASGYLHGLVGGEGDNTFAGTDKNPQTISNIDDPNMLKLIMPYPLV